MYEPAGLMAPWSSLTGVPRPESPSEGFANPMATVAAIDRIVHHSVIMEFDLTSYRTNAAQNRQTDRESVRQNYCRCSPLTSERDQGDRARILLSFPEIGEESEQYALLLRRYLDSRPEKFFDRAAFDTYLRWFQTQDQMGPAQLRAYLSQFSSEINRALLFLRVINSAEWHDSPLKNEDDYDLIRMIDGHVQPVCLRLVEGVFTPFVRPLAYFYRTDRNKGVDGLNVWSITNELKGQKEEHLVRHYQHTIRNGIAHGKIAFLQRQIRYRDLKGHEETFDKNHVIRLFDDMLDIW